MQTVFSHIVQKRFSQMNEDVATDALAFILHSNGSARGGMMKLLREVAPGMPDLQFRTQQVEGAIRPDMWGMDDAEPRVFVENKFWAGLTENQPVSYLRQLARFTQPAILLVVAPEAREHSVWRELIRRIEGAGIRARGQDPALPAGIASLIRTELGPILALTSWRKLLAILDVEVADHPGARNDLMQLRALCDEADNAAFTPLSSAQMTDQRTPALILQLSAVVQAAVELAVAECVLNITRLNPQASWERIGRYARINNEMGAGIWLGTHFDLWKTYGGTPLWIIFSKTEFGRAHEVQPLLEPWAAREGLFTARRNNGGFLVALDLEVGEEKDRVVRGIVDRLKGIAGVLSALGSKEGRL